MPGNSLGITLPTVGVTTGTQYATDINAALTTIINDIEAKVTPDEIDVNQNFSFASGSSKYAATDLSYAGFENKTGTLAASFPNVVYVVSGELYYQDASGNNVQITSGGSVNNAAAGSINTTGSPAYGASGVELLWSGTDGEFRFKSGSGDNYADIVVDDVELRNGANTTTIDTDVTTDYTVTFPTVAATSNNAVVQIDTTGDLSFTGDPSVDTLTASGNIEGSKLYHSSTETKMFTPYDYVNFSGTAPTVSNRYVTGVSGSFSNHIISLSPHMLATNRITEIRLDYDPGVASSTWQMSLYHSTSGANAVTEHENDSWTPGGTGFQQQTWTLSSPYTITNALHVYILVIIGNAASSSKFLYGLRVTYDRSAP